MALDALAFPITCCHCGAMVNLFQSVVRAGTEAMGIVRCENCRREYAVTVHMRRIGNDESSSRQRVRRERLRKLQ